MYIKYNIDGMIMKTMAQKVRFFVIFISSFVIYRRSRCLNNTSKNNDDNHESTRMVHTVPTTYIRYASMSYIQI